MRAACRLALQTQQVVAGAIRPGVTTGSLDRIADDYIRSLGAVAAFKGYQGFPAATCISINDELIHGIPGPRVIRDGDIVSVDLGVQYQGLIGDLSRTYAVGTVPAHILRLVDAASGACAAACAVLKAGVRVGDVSHAVQSFCESRGLSVVRDYVGHGVGRKLHEPPQVPNYGAPRTGDVIPAGATLAIEPMVTLGAPEVKVLGDKWTVVTKDGLPCAHYENTVLVTEAGCEVLTDPRD